MADMEPNQLVLHGSGSVYVAGELIDVMLT